MKTITVTNDKIAQTIGLVLGKEYVTKNGTHLFCQYHEKWGGVCLVDEYGRPMTMWELGDRDPSWDIIDEQGNLVLFEVEDKRDL